MSGFTWKFGLGSLFVFLLRDGSRHGSVVLMGEQIVRQPLRHPAAGRDPEAARVQSHDVARARVACKESAFVGVDDFVEAFRK